MYMDILLFVLRGVVPVFLLVVCGWLLKQKNIIGEPFLKNSSRMSFTIAIPALAFLKISTLDFNQVFILKEILLLGAVHLFIYILSLVLAMNLAGKNQQGVVVQAAFRGNVVIIGIALVMNLYNEELTARAAMAVAFLLPLFNVLSVIALTLPIHGFTPGGLKNSLRNIVKNPIILSVLTAMLFSLLKIPVPPILEGFLKYLADLALPLALITIGGSLTAKGIRKKGVLTLIPTILKLLVMPALGVLLFYWTGYRGNELGMVFLLLGAPTAVSSHIMADAMENDGELAALAVMFTTAGAALTTTLGLTLVEKLH